MHRLCPPSRVCRALLLLAPILFGSAASGPTTADDAPPRPPRPRALEEISGKTLTILRDAENVTVKHGQRVLVRYRYAGVPGKPYVSEMTSPAGINVLRRGPADRPAHGGLMFGWSVDEADFWNVGDDCGTQIHEKWKGLRIDSIGGSERAVLHEQLIWETADGDIILEEQRTLTVPAAADDQPRMLIWQADFTPGEDATGTIAITGPEGAGLGMRLIEPMDAGGEHFNGAGGTGAAGTNGKRAPWSAYTAPAGPGGPITVAMFDSPANPRHPTPWFTGGRQSPLALLSATLGVDGQPLKLEPGKTMSVRFGVVVFDGPADAARVNATYLRWYQLQAAARSGLAPGLLARYFAGRPQGEPACTRIDPSVAFDWSGGMPDDRLPLGPFAASWKGQVRVDREGDYRFRVNTARGEARVWVDEELVYAPGMAPDREPSRLEFGYHPIRVEYVATGDASGGAGAGLKLIWESNHFAPEAINPRYLVHDATLEAAAAMDLLHDPGRVVFGRYGCARCHPIPGVATEPRPGAPLGFASQAGRGYLARWLRDPQSVRPGTPMPAVGGKPEEIEAEVPAMVAYLKSLTPPKPIKPVVGDVSDVDRKDLIEAGRRRFRQLGCAACHAPEAPSQIDVTLAPSLADAGAKWPEGFVREFLLDPVGWHPEGGMPDFALKPADSRRLAAYLSTFGKADPAGPAPAEAEQVARGRKLVEERRCAVCHLLDEIGPPAAASLGPGANLSNGCLRTDRAAGSMPHFTLPPADRVAMGEFLARRPDRPSNVAAQELAQRTIDHRLACLQCHTRNGAGGRQLSRAVLRFAGQDKVLDQVSLTPPDISGAGARLQRPWMDRVLSGNAPSARPWLKVRMPGFAMTDRQRNEIADWLTTADAIPDLRASRPHRLPAGLSAVAGTLLGASGFSCINCHYIGKTPSSSETSAPDLTMITRRVNRDWFHRWLANPARIIPSTPMPAFNVPATRIAHEDLLVQTEAVWQFLKHTPAGSIKKMLAEGTTAVRVAGQRPIVVQGVIKGFAGLTRGIALGFSSRNSLVFDFERVAWRACFQGGFLDEAGRHGAQHYWEPVGRWKQQRL